MEPGDQIKRLTSADPDCPCLGGSLAQDDDALKPYPSAHKFAFFGLRRAEKTPPNTPRQGTETAEPKADLNLRIFASLGRYIDRHHGRLALLKITEKLGLSVQDLLGSNQWISHELAEELMQEARRLLPNDEDFMRACAFEMTRSYGPLLFALRSMSVRAVFEQGCRTMPLVSRISTYDMVESARNRLVVRYKSVAHESRSLCLSRMAQLEFMPTIWNLPKARIAEHSCIAHGDEACEYEVTWLEHRRWYPALLGAFLGALPIAGFFLVGYPVEPLMNLLPLVGACLGNLLELARANRVNLELGDQTADALREFAQHEAETRLELLALTQRQHEWGRLMETKVTERTLALQRIIERLSDVEKERDLEISGFSHDLGSPLVAIRLQNAFLRENAPPHIVEALEAQALELERVRIMLEELMCLTKEGRWLEQVAPEEIPIERLAEELARRARALAHGRLIQIDLTITREAPSLVFLDRFLLDRIADDLLSAAALRSKQGRIRLEIDGRPGLLVLKISDNRAPLEGGQSSSQIDVSSEAADPDSGLHIVAETLRFLGGSLEIMRLPNGGTTVWARIPVAPPHKPTPQPGGFLPKDDA